MCTWLQVTFVAVVIDGVQGRGGSQLLLKKPSIPFILFYTATPAKLYGGVGSAHAACSRILNARLGRHGANTAL
jgi:hypothetical protein